VLQRMAREHITPSPPHETSPGEYLACVKWSSCCCEDSSYSKTSLIWSAWNWKIRLWVIQFQITQFFCLFFPCSVYVFRFILTVRSNYVSNRQ
jgi:hypothetical protein